MALFVVNLTADVVVEAETQREAHEAARVGVDDLDAVDFGSFVVREVKCEDDLPDGWDADDRPLGSSLAIYRHLDAVRP